MVADLTLVLVLVAASLSARAGGAPPEPTDQPHVIVEVTDSGFHWLDAGIGAAAALAAVLLVVGLILSVRQLKTERRVG
jgi:ABC-type sugar transport system permease subunit